MADAKSYKHLADVVLIKYRANDNRQNSVNPVIWSIKMAADHMADPPNDIADKRYYRHSIKIIVGLYAGQGLLMLATPWDGIDNMLYG